jgi:hypothetical protein
MAQTQKIKYIPIWTPQPGAQLNAVMCTWCPELLYGGARGGGKTDFLLGDYYQDVPTYGQHWRGCIFRRSLPELDDIISRSLALFTQTGADYSKTRKLWTFKNGATLRFRHLERDEDAQKYQGHSYSFLGFDEVGNFPSIDPVLKIFACLRSAHDIPTKRIRLTANPGGPGHSWVKARYIDPAPRGLAPILDPISNIERIYIPSRVTDNLILMRQDPMYVARLQQVGSAELVRAWLDGDWNAVQGAYFGEFGAQHIIRPFTIPDHWLRFGCFDWGSASPYCYLWCAVSDGTISGIPKDAIVVYREDYGQGDDGKGRKWTAEQVAEHILSMQTKGETIYSVGDPSMFKEDGGPSIAERMAKVGLRMRPADNKRIAGWDAIRQRLKGTFDDYAGENRPLLYIADVCKHLVRTLPNLQHDSRHPEDLDTTAEDHAADALRYGVMSRPYTVTTTSTEPIKGMEGLTLDVLIAREKKRQGRYRSNRI